MYGYNMSHMKRTGACARAVPALSGLEHEVMQVVLAAGPCTVETVHRAIERQRPLKEVTVRTVLRRLEQKGYLAHDVEGRAYVYRAVEAQRSLAARAFRQILDRFCDGSVEELVSGVVEANVLSDAELRTLEETVRAQARARTAPPRQKRRT
jgi:predicted transcriptional regulator